MPPQFPWTDISAGDGKVHHYWDGGIVDNTPLGDAIDAFSSTIPALRGILVVMNLFPQTASHPAELADAQVERAASINFASAIGCARTASTARQHECADSDH